MTATIPDIIGHLEKWIDTTGWKEKYVQMEGPACAAVSIIFENGEPRVWRLVSKDSFATLDKVTIYEMAQPGAVT